jgi:tRNA-2-methylthio-N6-dimethylallyladenosine synthase
VAGVLACAHGEAPIAEAGVLVRARGAVAVAGEAVGAAGAHGAEAGALAAVRRANDGFLLARGRRRRAGVMTFGCQMNENDSERILGALAAMGFDMLPAVPAASALGDGSAIDLLLFNTCCVRENAEQRFFGVLGSYKRLKTLNPQCLIAVCGCMANEAGAVAEVARRASFVDFVFGPQSIGELPSLLRRAYGAEARPELAAASQAASPAVQSAGAAAVAASPAAPSAGAEVGANEIAAGEGAANGDAPMRRRPPPCALVSIMTGCDNFCTYCIVPHVRGREKSRAPASILAEAEALARRGYREITLLGQNVNSYGAGGFDLPCAAADFADLLRQLARIDGIERLRFMTSHPKDLSDRLIDAIRDNGKICRHVHLPVQSGSSAVLKRMNRLYTREAYLELVRKIRGAVPGVAITTDIIVGFPGETERDFEDTLDLVRRADFDMAYTFMYSKRRGTPAAAFDGQVGRAAMKIRFDRLLALQGGISLRKNQALVGSTAEVLCEGFSKADPAKYTGRTSGGKIVNFSSGCPLKAGQTVGVRITGARSWSLSGAAGDKNAGDIYSY